MKSESETKILVTLVHDDTTEVKVCINKLKRNLIYVDPSVDFKFCHVRDFQDSVFKLSQNVLAMLSKRSEPCREKIYASFVRHQRSFLAKSARLCAVIETDNPGIEEKYVAIIGRDNIALVHNLHNTFAWLPKVCVFLFKPSKERKYLQQCVVPRTVEDPNIAMLRQSLIKSLTELRVSVTEDLNEISKCHCGFLVRKREEETVARFIRKKLNANKTGGPIILDYVVHFDDSFDQDGRKRVTFAQESQVLFVLHVLYIVGLIDVRLINGEKVQRRISRARAFWENVPWTDLIGCFVLSMLNPALIVYILTPIPYIALVLSAITGKKFIWTFCLSLWMVLSLFAMYGVGLYYAALETYFVYVLIGLCAVFVCSSFCTYLIVKLGSDIFEKYRALSLI